MMEKKPEELLGPTGDSMSVFFNRSLFRTIAFLGAISCSVASPLAFGQQPYQIVDHWKVGGVGGWDYLLADPAAHLIYVTHGPQVEVIDTKTGKMIATITGMKGTHGIALDSEGKYGYISDGGSNNVFVFDRHSFKTVTTIPAGTNPDGIVFEPVTKSVWAFNGRSKNVTVVDSATNKVVATIDVPGKPEFPVADGHGSVYDNIETANEIVRFDARTMKLTETWKLSDCDSPSGLAMDREHRKLFAVCDGKKMAVVDADSGKQIASPEIGDGPDAANFSAKHQLAFSSNGEGTLTVIDTANGYKVVQNLPTARGARTMTYDDLTDRAYLVTAKFGPLPEPTEQVPHPRPAALPDSFEVIVVGRK
jgi:YVTN family beta-propeller protein